MVGSLSAMAGASVGGNEGLTWSGLDGVKEAWMLDPVLRLHRRTGLELGAADDGDAMNSTGPCLISTLIGLETGVQTKFSVLFNAEIQSFQMISPLADLCVASS